MNTYDDEEWDRRPQYDEALFELMTFEVAQAGSVGSQYFDVAKVTEALSRTSIQLLTRH